MTTPMPGRENGTHRVRANHSCNLYFAAISKVPPEYGRYGEQRHGKYETDRPEKEAPGQQHQKDGQRPQSKRPTQQAGRKKKFINY
jgi:hypothetical protein